MVHREARLVCHLNRTSRSVQLLPETENRQRFVQAVFKSSRRRHLGSAQRGARLSGRRLNHLCPGIARELVPDSTQFFLSRQ